MGRRSTAFDSYLAKQMKNPAFKAEFEKASAEIKAVDTLIRAIDAARVALQMSKTELANKIGASPPAVRRMFTSQDANPTFGTVLEMLAAVGLKLSISSANPGPKRAAARARVRKNSADAATLARRATTAHG